MEVMALNPHGSFEDMKTKRLQIIYLKEVEHLTAKQIAEFVDYSVNTIKSYMYKFSHLLAEAKKLFGKITVAIISKIEQLGEKGTEKCYLFKFYNEEKILFSKIGTTTREILTRLKEEVKSYSKSGFKITKVIIEDVVDCGSIPAEGLESFCRAKFIRNYPNAFKKNDRFMEVDIPVEEFKRMTAMYLE